MANKYKVNVNHAKQRRFLRFSKVFIVVVVLIVLAVGAYIIIDSIIEKNKSSVPSTPTKPVSSTVEPSVEVFSSPYFQFQTDKNWRFIANESTSTKFTYRRGADNLVSGDMTVYINSSPTSADMQATRVLPVSIKADDQFRLEASFVSEHCNSKLPKDIKYKTGEIAITLNSVRFLCDVDGTNYTIIVGLENGTEAMNFKRPDGTNANYIIFFRDLRAVPVPKEFENIMDTFQIR
ncbi:MAG: hypothetical protein U0451_00180 [Candidatus Saccharimonadales bacterium]